MWNLKNVWDWRDSRRVRVSLRTVGRWICRTDGAAIKYAPAAPHGTVRVVRDAERKGCQPHHIKLINKLFQTIMNPTICFEARYIIHDQQLTSDPLWPPSGVRCKLDMFFNYNGYRSEKKVTTPRRGQNWVSKFCTIWNFNKMTF